MDVQREPDATHRSRLLATATPPIAACVDRARATSSSVAPSETPPRRGTSLRQREGLTEVVTIAETSDGRLLMTNGHAMSSTAPAVAALHARAGAHPAADDGRPGVGARDRVRRRQYHACGDAPSVGAPHRDRRPLPQHPRTLVVLRRCESRRPERAPSQRVRQRRTSAPSDPEPRYLRSDHARAAAHRIRRRRCAVLEGVLRACAIATDLARISSVSGCRRIRCPHRRRCR